MVRGIEQQYGSPQADSRSVRQRRAEPSRYAQIAQRYAAEYGYDAAALAKIAVISATNASAFPGAVFHGKPITVDDVLDSPVIADPLHMLEIVMPVQGGAGVLIANSRRGASGSPPTGVDQGLR